MNGKMQALPDTPLGVGRVTQARLLEVKRRRRRLVLRQGMVTDVCP